MDQDWVKSGKAFWIKFKLRMVLVVLKFALTLNCGKLYPPMFNVSELPT